MAERVISSSEVSINGEFYKLLKTVQTSSASQYPPKRLTGDIDQDSQERLSVVRWSSSRGGIGKKDNETTTGASINGDANTGSGGGGSRNGIEDGLPRGTCGSGGSGIVILSIPTSSYSGTVGGSPSVSTSGSNTIVQFTGSGTYTT